MKLKPLGRLLGILLGLAALDTSARELGGPYAGLALGYVAGEDTGHETPVSSDGTYTQATHPAGGLLALSTGYDFKLSQRWLLGLDVEAELRNQVEHSVQKLDGTPTSIARNGFVDPTTFSSNFAFTVGPRLGYLLYDGKTIVSATTGLAVAHVKRAFGCNGPVCTPAVSMTEADWQTGWAAGADIERLVTTQLAVGIAYRHAEFGNQDVNVGALFNPISREHQRYAEDSLRFVVRYWF